MTCLLYRQTGCVSMRNQSLTQMDREFTVTLHQGNGWRRLRWALIAAAVIDPFVHLNNVGHKSKLNSAS